MDGTVSLRLPTSVPFAGADVLEFIGGRAIAGVESWDGVTYRRSLMLAGGQGTVTLRAADDHVAAEFLLADRNDLDAAAQRIRRLLDLDADSETVDAALSTEPVMARLVADRPGRRAPGSIDPFETSIRAIIGQQISVAGARTVAASLVRAVGERLDLDDPELTHVFPTPAAVVEAPDAAFPMPTSRRDTLRRLAGAVTDGEIVLDPGADPDATRAALLAVKGIGPWTADYVAMRGLSHPDIFLTSDLGVRHGLDQLADATGARPDPSAWAPWRSYAVHHIWAHLGARRENT
jgi:AraC family transcriptional regulator, regulatory protein of adaptative response / DNA-3-methyladenine glycosylase II